MGFTWKRDESEAKQRAYAPREFCMLHGPQPTHPHPPHHSHTDMHSKTHTTENSTRLSAKKAGWARLEIICENLKENTNLRTRCHRPIEGTSTLHHHPPHIAGRSGERTGCHRHRHTSSRSICTSHMTGSCEMKHQLRLGV